MTETRARYDAAVAALDRLDEHYARAIQFSPSSIHPALKQSGDDLSALRDAFTGTPIGAAPVTAILDELAAARAALDTAKVQCPGPLNSVLFRALVRADQHLASAARSVAAFATSPESAYADFLSADHQETTIPTAILEKHSNPHTAKTPEHIADLIELQDAGVFPKDYDLYAIIQSHHPVTSSRLWQDGCNEFDRRHQHDNDEGDKTNAES